MNTQEFIKAALAEDIGSGDHSTLASIDDKVIGSAKLIVKEAGKVSIQVIDDGKGMSPQDALMSFERHATSKISKAED